MEKKNNNNKNGSSQRRNQRPTYIGTYIGRGIIRVGNRLKNQYFFFFGRRLLFSTRIDRLLRLCRARRRNK